MLPLKLYFPYEICYFPLQMAIFPVGITYNLQNAIFTYRRGFPLRLAALDSPFPIRLKFEWKCQAFLRMGSCRSHKHKMADWEPVAPVGSHWPLLGASSPFSWPKVSSGMCKLISGFCRYFYLSSDPIWFSYGPLHEWMMGCVLRSQYVLRHDRHIPLIP